LVVGGADPKAIARARDELLAKQRPDGGWAQLDPPAPGVIEASRRLGLAGAGLGLRRSQSDAYATGTALVALRRAGVGPSDAAYQHGAAYLLKTQESDGSWRVKSRSKPFQTYFETGFPHGPDQFISSAATGWAATALALMLPVRVEPN
jgi:hypothetical protein